MEMHAARSESGIHAICISGCDWCRGVGSMMRLIRRDFGGMFGQEFLAESRKISSLLLLLEESLKPCPGGADGALCLTGELPLRVEADSNGCWVCWVDPPCPSGLSRAGQVLRLEQW
jgi:hypothetical protein